MPTFLFSRPNPTAPSRPAPWTLLLLVIGFLAAPPAAARQAGQQAPPPTPVLFDQDAVLELTLATDLSVLFKDRKEDAPEHPATLTFRMPDSTDMTLDLKVRTRGHHRLNDCTFPPIRLNLPDNKVKGTVFTGLDKVKLVTHCEHKKESYQNHLFQEYLAYKAYNILTPYSNRARLARITYIDTSGKQEPLTRFAVLLEPDALMARRNGGVFSEQQGFKQTDLHLRQMMLVAVFQYMIGNTDWAVSIMHNIKFVIADPPDTPYPVAYDFDWSGIVNAPYATPRADLDIRTVRERHYVGPCYRAEDFAPTFAVFNEHKEEILGLYRTFPYLDDKQRKRTVSYLEDFYENINTRRLIRDEFILKCGIYD
jgi:hypothetical protein